MSDLIRAVLGKAEIAALAELTTTDSDDAEISAIYCGYAAFGHVAAAMHDLVQSGIIVNAMDRYQIHETISKKRVRLMGKHRRVSDIYPRNTLECIAEDIKDEIKYATVFASHYKIEKK